MFTEEERIALRLPKKSSEPDGEAVHWKDDRGDPLGGGEADSHMFESAQWRVQRNAARGDYNGTASATVPLAALVGRVTSGGSLCAGLLFCWYLNEQAGAGQQWALDTLESSDQWLFGSFGWAFGKPPGGWLTLVLAALNGINVLRVLPLLFDRLLISRLPRSESEGEESVGDVE